jgi:hypothetical protein
MLNNCVSSALKGGYDGDIYVVSHIPTCSSICELGTNVKFVHTGVKTAEPTDTLIYKGYKAFDKKYDLMIYSHNDTVYHDKWWEKLQEAWNAVNPDKVGIITVPANYDVVNVNNPSHKLGFSHDIYNPEFSGRFSPCSSFVPSLYADTIESFGWNTYFAMELFISYEAIVKHKWSAMANTGCIVDHIGNGDMGLSKDFGVYFAKTYRVWFDKLGYNLEHFIAVWFGCVLQVHKKEILEAINSGDYESVEHIFDASMKSIKNTNCNACGLICRIKGRAKQPYR